MELISVKVHGFKRFEGATKMNVDGKVIALVGPNEAGKSSFLRAMIHLNNRDGFIRSGGSQELTRNVSIADDQNIVEAQFLLDESDRRALSHVPRANTIRWFSVFKRAKGDVFYVSLTPSPERDLTLRKKVLAALKTVSSLLPFQLNDSEQATKWDIPSLIKALDSEVETLPKELIQRIRDTGTVLKGVVSDFDGEHSDVLLLIEKLYDLALYEEAEHPAATARNILVSRKPSFLVFGDEERSLQPEYALDSMPETPPSALRNLARLAGLDLTALRTAMAEQDYGRVETLEEEANARLRRTFSENWSQSGVTVRLRVDNATLHVLVGGSQFSYVSIAERSDGLRQFVALLAFVTLEPTEQIPILLVDEAENHLHYDAQADLIQMFTRQEVVSKVIYTTHSVGCLPEDLGTGVRLIEPLDEGTSTVRNWFWESEAPGFSTLLFGMGAKTMAFIPIRFALVTEGASDMILLPTLLRQATGQSYLGFQVVPGLSSTSPDDIALLEQIAPRTAYLVDSDSGGDDLRRKLRQGRITEDRIFRLPGENRESLVIEDFIDAETYLGAVNQELHRSHGSNIAFPWKNLPDVSRPSAVKDWCKSQGIAPPNKRAVAYRVLESRREKPILQKHRVESLTKLYLSISRALNIQDGK